MLTVKSFHVVAAVSNRGINNAPLLFQLGFTPTYCTLTVRVVTLPSQLTLTT